MCNVFYDSMIIRLYNMFTINSQIESSSLSSTEQQYDSDSNEP